MKKRNVLRKLFVSLLVLSLALIPCQKINANELQTVSVSKSSRSYYYNYAGQVYYHYDTFYMSSSVSSARIVYGGNSISGDDGTATVSFDNGSYVFTFDLGSGSHIDFLNIPQGSHSIAISSSTPANVVVTIY